jgi:carbon-monoxide dehydrogenase medium subunit
LASATRFVAPTTLPEALTALEEEGAMVVAGGTSVGVLLKNRLVEPTSLVFLGHVPGLTGVSAEEDGSLRIGAMTTLHDLAREPSVREAADVVAKAASLVGNPRVRSIATIGGAIVHGDPRQDLPPVLLALRATVAVLGPRGARKIPMEEFLVGFMESALEEDELVTEVVLPPRHHRRSAYSRFTPNSEDDYPTVGVAASLWLSSEGTVEDVVLALGGVDTHAITVPGAADLLRGRTLDEPAMEEVARAASAAARPTDDNRGSEDYKRAMIEVWTKRALRQCANS